MATRTLATFKTNSSYLADMENAGNFIGSVEHTKYVNDAIGDLFDVVVDADNGKLLGTSVGNLSPALGTVGSGNGWYLPPDFSRLVSVHITDGTRPYIAHPADPADWVGLLDSPPPATNSQYLLTQAFGEGETILYTFPAVAESRVLLRYIPTPPVLSDETDEFTGSTAQLDYIEHNVAVRMLQKEESDTTAVEYALAKLTTRVQNAVKDVDLNTPRTIRMNRRRGMYYKRGR